MMQMLLAWMVQPTAECIGSKEWVCTGDVGRMYIDMSMYMHLLGNDKLAKRAEVQNQFMARVITSGELERYRPAKPPKHVRLLRMLGYLPRCCGTRDGRRRCCFAQSSPDAFRHGVPDAIAAFETWITRRWIHRGE